MSFIMILIYCDNMRAFEIFGTVYWTCRQEKRIFENERRIDMATYTENFDLIKPDDADYYDVADFNANMDIIDEALTESAGISGVISADGQGVRIIKSIQHKTVTLNTSGQTEVSISPVDASRCIVILERLYDGYNYTGRAVYTLQDDKIVINQHQGNSTYQIILGFWVVEFY